jgi:hypothetical protein
MNRLAGLRYLAMILYDVALSMLDGSYYREEHDPQIGYCGGGVGDTEMGFGGD